MAFAIETSLKGYEYRVLREDSFTDDDGLSHPYMQLVIEHVDTCEQSRVSVPKKMWDDVRSLGLRKAQLVDLRVHARAGASYSKLELIEVEHAYTPEGEVLF